MSIEATSTTAAERSGRVTMVSAPAADEAHRYFTAKLAYEADPADVATDIAGGADFTLIDCRPTGNYTKAHLPGAISLPWPEVTAESVQALPAGLLVTYCWGPSCNAATKGAMLLAAHGRQVKELTGGLEYWIREGHPTEGRRTVEPGEAKPSDWGLQA